MGEVVRRVIVKSVMMDNGQWSFTGIARELGVEKGGRVTGAMMRLAEAGLVSADIGQNPETGAVSRDRRYRLRDNYMRYYLKLIEPVKEIVDSGAYRFTTLIVRLGFKGRTEGRDNETRRSSISATDVTTRSRTSGPQ